MSVRTFNRTVTGLRRIVCWLVLVLIVGPAASGWLPSTAQANAYSYDAPVTLSSALAASPPRSTTPAAKVAASGGAARASSNRTSGPIALDVRLGIAAEDTVAGSGRVFSGHGGIEAGDEATTVVPKGTCIRFYCSHGETVSDTTGNAIETGHPPAAVETFGPGETITNYWLEPPTGPNIMGNPFTVSTPTRLSDLLGENMGTCEWAACRSVVR